MWIFFGPFAAIFFMLFLFACYRLLPEYFHNQARHFYELTLMLPLMVIATSIVAFVSHAISGPVLLCWIFIILRIFGRIPFIWILAISPVLALLTWFGYDHLVPDYRFFTDDRTLYSHGLTLSRYLTALAFDLTMVAIYWIPMRNYRPNQRAAA
jgi:hypothetical protein